MIYSNLLPDSALIKSVENYNSIAIIVCPVCGNLSIGYQKNIPAFRKTIDETTGETIYERSAITGESNRIKGLLEAQGKQVKIGTYGAPCIRAMEPDLPEDVNGGGDADMRLADQCEGKDAVLALCCSVGTLGLKRRLGDSMRIVPGMKTLGISQFSFIFDESKELVYADRENSTIIPSVTSNSEKEKYARPTRLD